MTHLWWRAITENDRFRPTYRGRRPIVRHAGRAPAENPCPNLLRRNGPPDPLGNVKAAAISDKFRETTGSFRSAPLTRLSGGAPSHQPTSFVRSDSTAPTRSSASQALRDAAAAGFTALAGSSPIVNVVALALGGGRSWFGRKYGWVADSIRALEVVTPQANIDVSPKSPMQSCSGRCAVAVGMQPSSHSSSFSCMRLRSSPAEGSCGRESTRPPWSTPSPR